VNKLSPLIVAALAVFFGWSVVSADMVGQKLPSSTLNFVGSKPEMDGKPLLLEFWATWCPPCRTSIPHLNEIHEKFKDRGLLVVGVTDEPNSVIKKFQKEVPMDYAVATDTGGRLNEKMGISGIPHAFLVNKSGEIVWQGHPNRLTDEDIEKILE
jgi:cytochrome c biogenesis protein CcmG, thiol:disulfide interchange protein DsbE